MEDIQEKLKVLLDYWIEHNGEHEQEFREWADKVAPSSAQIAGQLRKAAAEMAAVSGELMKAKQALPKSRGRRQDVHG
jgi:rubrerythrin